MDPFKPFSVSDIGLNPGTVISVTAFEDGSQFDVYATDKEVGAGLSGCVILGNSVSTDDELSTLALKVFRSMLDPSAKELLRRELAVVKRLGGRHPNILPFLGEAVFNGTNVILVSRYMKNGNLTTYLKSGTTPCLPLVRQVADAVRYLHDECGLAHGDLKCENVLVSDGGDALVADFGLSTDIERSDTNVTSTTIRRFCTLRFAAPELLTESAKSAHGQVRSKTRESDVYAFGMLVIQAFSGVLPWAHLDRDHIASSVLKGATHPHPGIAAVNRGFSDQCWETCMSCWKFDPQERPTMARVISLLTPISASPIVEHAAETRDEDRARSLRYPDSIQPGAILCAQSFREGRPFNITVTSMHGQDGVAQAYFGDANLPSGRKFPVAVKFGPVPQGEPHKRRDILSQELEVARELRHVHLLPFLATARYDTWTALVTPFMNNGTMIDYLTAHPSLDCKPLILQVVDAVEYLHDQKSIVHGNIKCENVLISDRGAALLMDFNLRTVFTAPDSTTATTLTVSTARFSAPELLAPPDIGYSPLKTTQTDMYAFGMMTFQAFTRRPPWCDLALPAIIQAVVINRDIPIRPRHDGTSPQFSDRLWDACEECWAYDPQSRPTIQEIRRRLSYVESPEDVGVVLGRR